MELRLVPDDVPIHGRILDTQGRPIPGVNVRVGTIEEPPAGDLDALLRDGTIRPGRFSGRFYNAVWWTKEETEWVKKTIKTGPDGRFRIDGAGRDRLVLLEFDGPGIEHGRVWAMTRAAPPSARPRSVPTDTFLSAADLIRSMVRPSTMSPARPNRSRAWSGSRGPAVRSPGSRFRAIVLASSERVPMPSPTRTAGSASMACPRSRRTGSRPTPGRGNRTSRFDERRRHRWPEADRR